MKKRIIPNPDIEIPTKVKASSLIGCLLNNMPVKDIVGAIAVLNKEALSKLDFPSSLLATDKDVGDIEGEIICSYVYKNWDKIVPDAEKWWVKEMKRVRKEGLTNT